MERSGAEMSERVHEIVSEWVCEWSGVERVSE